MRYALSLAACMLLAGFLAVEAHDRVTTSITWNREISRIVHDRCAGCHNPDGIAFSLLTYQDARPWAVAIKEEVLARRMPPWGAVKGFGEFRNDQALTAEQLELIVDWVEGGVPEGNPLDRLVDPKVPEPVSVDLSGALMVSGEVTLIKPLVLDGLFPESVPEGTPSSQITATLPDGSVEPLLWLYEYKPAFRHPFLLRQPLELPAGTVIRGVPANSTIGLIGRE